MTLEAEGAYIRLLAYSWQDGSIPADVEQLGRMCKCSPKKMAVLWDSYIRDCFRPLETNPDRLVNERLEEVRQKLLAFKTGRSEAGKKGAAQTWKDHGSANGKPNGSAIVEPIANDGSPFSSLQSPKKEYPEDFEVFWDMYPRKVGKGKALKSWKKVKPSRVLVQIIFEAIEKQKLSRDWMKENGQFIPYPATWLNEKRWDDEVQSQSVVRYKPTQVQL